jgi:restriction endonuclease Mrr
MDKEALINITKATSDERFDTFELLVSYYGYLGFNRMKAALHAENNLSNFVGFINNIIVNDRKKNIYPFFRTASRRVVDIDRDHFAIINLVEYLKNLDWVLFEGLSASILKRCFGATNVKVSPRTGDGGMDFQGEIHFKDCKSISPFGIIEVYGQSKRYKYNVDRVDIDKFTAFANRQKRDNRYPSQLFLFFTTSDYGTMAWKELEQNHFIGLNGYQLATLIFNFSEAKTEASEKLVNDFLS